MADDLHAGEEPVEVPGDDVLQRHEPALTEGDEPGEDRGYLDPGELPRTGDRVLQQHGEVDAQPRDVRERVGRVDGKRREDGEDPVLEELGHLVPLVGVQFLPAQDLDAVPGKRRTHVVREHPGGLGDELAGAGEDRVVQFPRHEAGVARHGEAGCHAALQACDAHHEELVEVGGEDREEPRTLQEWDALRVLGKVEHPVVEGQPRQFAIGEPVCRQFGRLLDEVVECLFVLYRGHGCS